MKQQILALIVILAFVRCVGNTDTAKVVTEKLVDNKSNHLKTTDTIIFISGVNLNTTVAGELTPDIAKEVLYQHYVKKGYYRADSLPDMAMLGENEENKYAVDFTNIYAVDFNKNRPKGAIISFWLTPPYASGHCWQPHKAIISTTELGYKISNEEFIPTNFAIDSIVYENSKAVIHGYDYDCGAHKVLRKLRIALDTRRE